jgi:hypothetical protein
VSGIHNGLYVCAERKALHKQDKRNKIDFIIVQSL